MIGTTAPDFTLRALVKGEYKDITLSNYSGKNVLLLFYPLDFTFVCPTELNAFSDCGDEFLKEHNCQVLYVSSDSVYAHKAWAETPRSLQGVEGVGWPMLSDLKREVSRLYCMEHPEGRPVRGTVIIDKNRKIRHYSVNDDLIGRSVPELRRLLDAINSLGSAKAGEFCPANWTKEGKESAVNE